MCIFGKLLNWKETQLWTSGFRKECTAGLWRLVTRRMCWGLCASVLNCKSFEHMLSDLPLYPAQHPAQCLANDRQRPINIGGAVLVSHVTRPWELPVHLPLSECCFFDSLSPGFSSCVFKLSWAVHWGTWWHCPRFCLCALPGFHSDRTEWLWPWQEELRKQTEARYSNCFLSIAVKKRSPLHRYLKAQCMSWPLPGP